MPALNSDYLVRIVQSDTNTLVQAPMPAEFMFDSQANYEAPFAQGLFGNGALASIARLGGLALTSQALTAQIWQGSNDTQLSVELEFQAESDVYAEVRDPIISLMKLATPSESPGTGMIMSPGPRLDISVAQKIWDDYKAQTASTYSALTDPSQTTTNGSTKSTSNTNNGNKGLGQAAAWKNKITNIISLQIGNYAFFDMVVISNVQATYTSQIDTLTGWPQHARINVQFKPMFQLLQGDLDNIFKNQSGNTIDSSLPTPADNWSKLR